MDNKFNIIFEAKSDIGAFRTENQDNFCIYPENETDPGIPTGILFMVADGMGGHQKGGEASRIAIETVKEEYFSSFAGEIPQSLQKSLEIANSKIFHHADETSLGSKMGTTGSILVLKDNRAFIAHVGDSRIYRIRKGKIEQLTEDHTIVSEMQKKGILSKSEAQSHPENGVLARALGMTPEVEVDIIDNLKIEEDDIYVLSSDGLSKVTKNEIMEIIEKKTMKDACDELIKQAIEKGSKDNITVIICKAGRIIEKNEIRDVAKKSNMVIWMIVLFILMLLAIYLLFPYFNNKTSTRPDEKNNTTETGSPEAGENSGTETQADLQAEAENLMNRDDLDGALEIYRKILKENPTNMTSINAIYRIAEKYKKLGNWEKDNGKYQSAEDYYSKALILLPNNTDLIKLIADCKNSVSGNISRQPEKIGNISTPKKVTEPKKTTALEEKMIENTSEEDKLMNINNWDFSGINNSDYDFSSNGIGFMKSEIAKKAIYKNNVSDFEINCEMDLTGSQKQYNAGMIVGYKSESDYYLVTVSGISGFLIEKISQDGKTVLSQNEIGENENNKFSVKVKCFGPWIMFYSNNKIVGTKIENQIISGKFGLYADKNTQINYKGLKISPAIQNGK